MPLTLSSTAASAEVAGIETAYMAGALGQNPRGRQEARLLIPVCRPGPRSPLAAMKHDSSKLHEGLLVGGNRVLRCIQI